MKRLTVRLEDFNYDRLCLLSKDKNASQNKLINDILYEFFTKPKEFDFVQSISNCLNEIEKSLTSIAKKQALHFKISSQHFANHGYLSNAAVDEDKCLIEILDGKKKYYD